MTATTSPATAPLVTGRIRPKLSRDDWIMRGAMVLVSVALFVVLVLPLYSMLSKSFEDHNGNFIGLANYAEYADTPALFYSIENSLTISVIATIIVISLAFLCAYALTRTCIPFKGTIKIIALVPILAPSLLPAISLIYLFGNQGMIKGLLMGHSIYGPIGIVIGASFWTFPHAMIIMTTALSIADGRLYEAAAALGRSEEHTSELQSH